MASTNVLRMVPTVLGVVGIVAACGAEASGTDGGASTDAVVPDAAAISETTLPSGADLAAPLPPAPVAAPAISCTRGWREIPPVIDGGASACDPWPAGGPVACEGATAHRPGESGCTDVGVRCHPSDPYATDLPAGGPTLFVRADAPPGGDGTRAAPFATVAAATAIATDGTVIAVGRGTYPETIVVPAGVALWGACAAETMLAIPEGTSGRAAVELSSGASARNLGVSGALAGVVSSGPDTEIEGILLEATTGVGILVLAGGALTARDVRVRTVRPAGGAVTGEGGILVEAGGSLEAERISIEGASSAGVRASGTLVLRDSALRDTAPIGVSGAGVMATGSASLELERVAIERNRMAGVIAQGATVRVSDSVVRETTVDDEIGSLGLGILADMGSTVTVERTLVERSTMLGVHVQQGSAARLTDVVVRDTQPVPLGRMFGGTVGTALSLTRGEMTGLRVSVERSTNAGIIVGPAGASAVFEDLAVLASVHSPGDLQSGESMVVSGGGEVTVTRGTFAGSEQHGVWLSGEGSHATLTDVTIRDVERRALDGAWGVGLEAIDHASATIERVLVERAYELAVLVTLDGALGGSDLTIRDTRVATSAAASFPGFGVGLFADFGAQVTLDRMRIEGSRAIGMFAGDGRTVVRLDNARITGTESWVSDSSLPSRLGHAFNVQREATLRVDGGIFDGNRSVGIQVSGGGRLELHDVIVRDTQPDEAHGLGGVGITAIAGGHIDGSLVRLERNHLLGASAYGEGSRLTLDGLDVIDTRENTCTAPSCAGLVSGLGIGAYDQAVVRVTNFRVATSALCGVMVARDGSLDLEDGVVSGGPIGANVQVPGYDIARLSTRVAYQDNERNLDSTELPIPQPLGSAAPMAPDDSL